MTAKKATARKPAKKPAKAKGAKAKAKAAPKPSGKAKALEATKPRAAQRMIRIPRRATEEDRAAEVARRKQITEAICEDYSTGMYTLPSVTAKHGIEASTFWHWRHNDPALHALFEKAQETYRKSRFEGLRELSLNSFEKLVAGFEFEETVTEGTPRTTEDGRTVTTVTKLKKTKGHVAPNPGMVAMAMKNLHGFTDGAGVNVGINVGGQGVFVIGGKEFEF